MAKWLLTIVILVLAFLWWNGGRRSTQKKAEQTASRVPQRMLSCAHCQLHLPEAEALRGDDGLAYCCAEHRQAGAASGAGP
jgi:uncharacterized protein